MSDFSAYWPLLNFLQTLSYFTPQSHFIASSSWICNSFKGWPHLDHVWLSRWSLFVPIFFVQEINCYPKLDLVIAPRYFWQTWKGMSCFWWRLANHGLIYVLGAVSDKCPGFCKCLIFSKSGFVTFRILLASKSDHHSQQAIEGAWQWWWQQ